MFMYFINGQQLTLSIYNNNKLFPWIFMDLYQDNFDYSFFKRKRYNVHKKLKCT